MGWFDREARDHLDYHRLMKSVGIGIPKGSVWHNGEKENEDMQYSKIRVGVGAVPMASTDLRWDDDDNWADAKTGEVFICDEESETWFREAWQTRAHDLRLVIFRGPLGPVIDGDGSQMTFILLPGDYVMVGDGSDADWHRIAIYTGLSVFLRDAGCEIGALHTACVFPVPSRRKGYVSVTKRRRLTLDIEVDVELDADGVPYLSPGNALFDHGKDMIRMFNSCPHFNNISVKYWNVDHMDRSNDCKVIEEDGEDFMKFKDQPGIWPSDRLNKVGDKRDE